MGVFLWKLILIKNAIAVDSSFPRFGIHFASKCVCCSSPCIERVDHLSQSDIARIDNRVSFLSQSQCGLILESSSLHHLLASWFNGAKSKSQGGNKAADCLAAYGHTHSDSILFNSLGSLPFDSKKPVHSQGINSESETIVLCRVREEIEHGILTGRSAKPVSTGVDPQKEKEYPEYITAIKKGSTELKPFIVSDLETIIVNNIHKPYAAGLMMVHPGKMIEKDMIIHTYYSEDYKVILDSFEERSRKVMIDLISMIERLVKQEKKAKTVYFHNFSRFDGIFLLKHLCLSSP
ncbi:DNA polymerase-like protein [Tanacetum coccineum]|uniref:DNA polymerase-like protein n=1 Tax=Tanacetum coccineum TaxID=301880 RepID=A0ABQ5BAI5_9ASTR